MTVLAYGVYILLGIFAIRFIFWEVPLRFSSYWKGVAVGATGVIILAGIGYLAQRNESSTFWLILVIILLIGMAMFFSSRKS